VQNLKNQRTLSWVRGQDRAHINDQIGRQLKTFYERCMTDELPPRLREALKKLDEAQEIPESSSPLPQR
jgi:hypothetical protein